MLLDHYTLSKEGGNELTPPITLNNWKPYENIINSANACAGRVVRSFDLNTNTTETTAIEINDISLLKESGEDELKACIARWVDLLPYEDGSYIPIDDWEYRIRSLGDFCGVKSSIFSSKVEIDVSNHMLSPLDINIVWWPEIEKSIPYENANVKGVVGMADIHITNPENGKSATINTQRFHIPNDYISRPPISKMSLDSQDLASPSFLNLTSWPRYELDWDTPFIFEDIDFDGSLELIIVNHGQGQRMGHAFEVFDVDTVNGQPTAKLKDYPPYNELDLYTEFDIKSKRVTSYRSGGACLSEYETYIITDNSSVPLELIKYDFDDSGCYKETYGYNHRNGKYVPVLLKKEFAD